MSLSDELMRIEEAFRTWAAFPETTPLPNGKRLSSVLSGLSEKVVRSGKSKLATWQRVADLLTKASASSYQFAVSIAECAKRGVKPSECEMSWAAVATLKMLGSGVKEATEKSCLWGMEEKATMYANSLASCIHRIAEYVRSVEGAKTVGRCVISPTASDRAKEACTIWNRSVDELDDRGMYSTEDYRSLLANVYDDVVEMVVGSSPGHESRIDFSKGEVWYYDTDDNVNKVMLRVLGNVTGGKCSYFSEGVRCEEIPEHGLKLAARALALSTSMDFRLAGEIYDPIIPEYIGEILGIDPNIAEYVMTFPDELDYYSKSAAGVIDLVKEQTDMDEKYVEMIVEDFMREVSKT